MLISSVDKTLEAMRWKIFHKFNPSKTGKKTKKTFGFPTTKSAPRPAPNCPSAKPLKDFEDRLLNLIKSVNFKDKPTPFQTKLKKDVEKINNDKNVFVAADKTNNFYKMAPENYKELLEKNINKEYKKSTIEMVEKIEKGDAKIAKLLDIEDRVHKTSKKGSIHHAKRS